VAHLPEAPKGAGELGVGVVLLEGQKDPLPLLEGHLLLQDPGLPEEV
jgi:hypothetical protein